MNYLRKAFGVLLLGAALAAPRVAAQQAEEKLNLSYGGKDNEKSAYASYWEGGPRVRIGFLDPANYSFGAFLPPSKTNLKLIASKSPGKKEFGLYLIRKSKDERFTIGSSFEYLSGKKSAEAHARIGLNRFLKVFAGYGNYSGTSIVSAGVFPDFGKHHLAAVYSRKAEPLPDLQFSKKDRLGLYYGREDLTYNFYHSDGRSHAFFGVLRRGESGRNLFSRKVSDAQRIDLAQNPIVHSPAWGFHISNAPQNTHLSDNGDSAVGYNFSRTPKSNQQRIDAFQTFGGRWIAGYGFKRSEDYQKHMTAREHIVSGGANTGPAKIIAGWNSRNGWYGYASFKRKKK